MRMRPWLEGAKDLDKQLKSKDLRQALDPGEDGWICATRGRLGVTVAELGETLGVTQSAMTQLQKREVAKTISIGKLGMIAEALGCELVYGFVPKDSFEEMATRVERAQTKADKWKVKLPRSIKSL